MFVSSDSHYSRLSVHWKNAKRRGNVIGALVSMLACRSHADSGTHQRRGKCDGMTRLDKKGRLGLGATLNQNPRRLKTAGKNRSRGKPPCRRTSRPPQRLALPQHDSYNTPPAGNVKRRKTDTQNVHNCLGRVRRLKSKKKWGSVSCPSSHKQPTHRMPHHDCQTAHSCNPAHHGSSYERREHHRREIKG